MCRDNKGRANVEEVDDPSIVNADVKEADKVEDPDTGIADEDVGEAGEVEDQDIDIADVDKRLADGAEGHDIRIADVDVDVKGADRAEYSDMDIAHIYAERVNRAEDPYTSIAK